MPNQEQIAQRPSKYDITMLEKKIAEAKVTLKELLEEEIEIKKKGNYYVDEDYIKTRKLEVSAAENRLTLAKKIQDFEAKSNALYTELEEMQKNVTSKDDIARKEHDIEILETIIDQIKVAFDKIYVNRPI